MSHVNNYRDIGHTYLEVLVKVQMKVHSSPMVELVELGNPKPYYNTQFPINMV